MPPAMSKSFGSKDLCEGAQTSTDFVIVAFPIHYSRLSRPHHMVVKYVLPNKIPLDLELSLFDVPRTPIIILKAIIIHSTFLNG